MLRFRETVAARQDAMSAVSKQKFPSGTAKCAFCAAGAGAVEEPALFLHERRPEPYISALWLRSLFHD